MPNMKTILLAKAKGLLTTLQMSAMQAIPPKYIGEQYNALLAEVLAAHADWAGHLPPVVEIVEFGFPELGFPAHGCRATYPVLVGYAERIVILVDGE